MKDLIIIKIGGQAISELTDDFSNSWQSGARRVKDSAAAWRRPFDYQALSTITGAGR